MTYSSALHLVRGVKSRLANSGVDADDPPDGVRLREECLDEPGQHPSAVMGDVVTVARNRLSGRSGPGESAYADRPVLPMGETLTRYHVAIDVDDRAGVLASVALAFADHGVSIQTVKQEGRGEDAQLVVVSHTATDAQLAATVEQLHTMDAVREVTSVMRVEGEAE